MRALPPLLLLSIPILNLSAQPLQLQPEWIEGGYQELEVYIGVPFNGSVHVEAALSRDSIVINVTSVEVSERHFKLRIWFPHEPGEYELRVSSAELNLSTLNHIYVTPSLSSLANLSSKLLKFEASYFRVKGLLEDASYFEEERKVLYEKFGNLTRLVMERRDPKSAALLFINISKSIDELSEKLLKVSGYEAFIWSSLAPLDSSLKLPPETHEFWVKLSSAMLLLLLILMFLYPLYMGYPDVKHNLESMGYEIDERASKLRSI